jgi:hypothetical protein
MYQPSCLDSPHSDPGEIVQQSLGSPTRSKSPQQSPIFEHSVTESPLTERSEAIVDFDNRENTRQFSVESKQADKSAESSLTAGRVSPDFQAEVDTVCSALLRSLDSPEPLLEADRTEQDLEPSESSKGGVSTQLPLLDEQSNPVLQSSEKTQEENLQVQTDPKLSSAADVGPADSVSAGNSGAPVRHPSGDQPPKFSCSVCCLKFKQEKDLQKHDCFLVVSDLKQKQRKRKLSSRTSSKKRHQKNSDEAFFQCPFQDCSTLEVQ